MESYKTDMRHYHKSQLLDPRKNKNKRKDRYNLKLLIILIFFIVIISGFFVGKKNILNKLKAIPPVVYSYNNYSDLEEITGFYDTDADANSSFRDTNGNDMVNLVRFDYHLAKNPWIPVTKLHQVLKTKSLKTVQPPVKISKKDAKQIDKICTKHFKKIDIFDYKRKKCSQAVSECKKEIVLWGKQKGLVINNLHFEEGINFQPGTSNKNRFILSENPAGQRLLSTVAFHQYQFTKDKKQINLEIDLFNYKEVPNRNKLVNIELYEVCKDIISQCNFADFHQVQQNDDIKATIKRAIINYCSKNNYGAVRIDNLKITSGCF